MKIVLMMLAFYISRDAEEMISFYWKVVGVYWLISTVADLNTELKKHG